MKTSGPDQRDCAECGKPIGNRPRVTLATGKVVCTQCHQKLRWIVDPADGNLRLATYDPQA